MNADNENYNLNDNQAKINRFSFNHKIVIIVIAITILLILIYMYFNNSSKDKKCSIELKAPSIIYIDRPVDIPVKLKGLDKYTKDSMTSFFSDSDDVINLPENEFYGKEGSILIKPISIGEDNISIISTIGTDKYTKELNTKQIHITVCPKFDNGLIKEQEVSIKKGTVKSLNIDFGPIKCSEIITYESNNTNTASVDENGLVTGVNTGNTDIIISNGSNNIITSINVID